jgi:hypothetical protein
MMLHMLRNLCEYHGIQPIGDGGGPVPLQKDGFAQAHA